LPSCYTDGTPVVVEENAVLDAVVDATPQPRLSLARLPSYLSSHSTYLYLERLEMKQLFSGMGDCNISPTEKENRLYSRLETIHGRFNDRKFRAVMVDLSNQKSNIFPMYCFYTYTSQTL
jgi:hypothetical protein